MKKAILMICGAIAAMVLTGCQSAYSVSDGFPRTLPGVLVASQTSGGYIAPKMQSMKDIKVLGPVSSEISATNVLMLVSSGNVSIAKAKAIALKKYPNADDVVNVEIDVDHFSILSLFNTVTVYYKGIAIQYNK